MKKFPRIYFLIFCLLLSITAFGQRPGGQNMPERKFTGKVIDGTAKVPMVGANVLIKPVTDSLLRGTVTGAGGVFEIARPFIPEVKLEITFLGYKTITKIHSMREPVELGELILLEDTKLLGEVVVQGVSVVGEQKGDTTSFNANAFKTQTNAQAEDLIRKMPGFTFQGGQIQAQGEQVQKVLVDGNKLIPQNNIQMFDNGRIAFHFYPLLFNFEPNVQRCTCKQHEHAIVDDIHASTCNCPKDISKSQA
jgi:hypothetical protein